MGSQPVGGHEVSTRSPGEVRRVDGYVFTYGRELPADIAHGLRAAVARSPRTKTWIAARIGISRPFLADLEAGRRIPSTITAEKLIKALALDDALAKRLRAIATPREPRS